MICFNNIEQIVGIWKSGLGNQMFHYAGLRGIASTKNYEFCIPPNTLLDDFFTLKGATYGVLEKEYQAKNLFDTFPYNKNFIDNCPDNVSIRGYFFSERYFEHIKKDIRSDFTFKPEILNTCLEIRSKYSSPIVAIQVRRGDYETSSDLLCCHKNYYLNALSILDSKLGSNLPVLVISNDPEWCLDTFEGDRFIFIVDSDERQSSSKEPKSYSYLESIEQKHPNRKIIYVPNFGYSMCLMTLCDHFIISNSTFGVWGAWLANKGFVIHPTKVFKHIPIEYYPKYWNWMNLRGW